MWQKTKMDWPRVCYHVEDQSHVIIRILNNGNGRYLENTILCLWNSVGSRDFPSDGTTFRRTIILDESGHCFAFRVWTDWDRHGIRTCASVVDHRVGIAVFKKVVVNFI